MGLLAMKENILPIKTKTKIATPPMIKYNPASFIVVFFLINYNLYTFNWLKVKVSLVRISMILL
jgi:hypothetical protein